MKDGFVNQFLQAGGLTIALLCASGCATSGRTYSSPEEAMQAVADVAGTGDRQRVEEIFGPEALEVISSGDPVADRADGLRVKQMILDRVEFEGSEDEVVAVVGDDRWPFPIPLVRTGSGWRFDLEAGEEELLNRRIGRNELQIIATLREYVHAQREYASIGRDGHPSTYAQKVRSTAGHHDGLYWPVAEGDPESPLGELVADAVEAGYAASADDGPRPFHGYYFRILTRQGAGAPGGERDYVNSRGLMTAGFAAVAWPATYDNSGVMTFLVNHLGIVFEKDLGPNTDKTVRSIRSYDPDDTWAPVVN